MRLPVLQGSHPKVKGAISAHNHMFVLVDHTVALCDPMLTSEQIEMLKNEGFVSRENAAQLLVAAHGLNPSCSLVMPPVPEGVTKVKTYDDISRAQLYNIRCVLVADATPRRGAEQTVRDVRRPLLAHWPLDFDPEVELRGICVDSDERVLVYSRQRLYWYTRDGQLLHMLELPEADIARVLVMGDGSLLVHEHSGKLRRVS